MPWQAPHIRREHEEVKPLFEVNWRWRQGAEKKKVAVMYGFVKKTGQITHQWNQHSLLQQGQKGGKYFRLWKRANVVCISVKYKQLCQVQTMWFTEYNSRCSTVRTDVGFGGFSWNLLKNFSILHERESRGVRDQLHKRLKKQWQGWEMYITIE